MGKCDFVFPSTREGFYEPENLRKSLGRGDGVTFDIKPVIPAIRSEGSVSSRIFSAMRVCSVAGVSQVNPTRCHGTGRA